MKKLILLTLALVALLCFVSCSDGSSELCKALGSHDLQYFSEGDQHWQECVQEGCSYKTKPVKHSGGTPTCYSRAKCEGCGLLYGTYADHNMKYESNGATEHTYYCTYDGCAEVYGPMPHSGGTATCAGPAKCDACGTEYGEVKAHSGGTATCTQYAKCDACGAFYGSLKAHTGGTATCTELAKCEVCNTSYGSLKAHSGGTATCTELAKCSACGVSYGSPKSHTLAANGVSCTTCNNHDVTAGLEFQLSPDGKSYILTSGANFTGEHLVIPAEYNGKPVTAIGEGAFSGAMETLPIKTVIFPDSIQSIESAAFFGTMLESVTIGAGVKTIGTLAFADCPNLKCVVIPDNVEVIAASAFSSAGIETLSIGSGVKVISSDAFTGTKLKRVVIPSTVEKIDEVAFSSSENLQEVIIGDGVKEIGGRVFMDCGKLKKVTLPNTLETLSYDAFTNCHALEYTIHEGMKYLGSESKPCLVLMGSNGGTRLVAHADTVLFAPQALYNCEDVVSVEIGPNVKYIGSYALAGMDALEQITVDAKNAYYYATNNLLYDRVARKPIQGCKASVIPSDGSVTELNLSIFSSIATLKTIVVPEGVRTLHLSFSGLSGLESIIIGSDVNHLIIGGNFDECKVFSNGCYTVYYCHTKAQWSAVEVETTIEKNPLFKVMDCYSDTATHYYYSETAPVDGGKYWHYVDGVPTIWTNKK